MSIRVNGTEIGERAIAAEMQHHPAPTREEAWQAAAHALVVRQLLLDEAERAGIGGGGAATGGGEADDDLLPEERTIEALLEGAVSTPDADPATCRRWYEANRGRFRSPELWEASHILIAADPEDAAARAAAKARAEELLALVKADPAQLAELARQYSDCPSRSNGGHLGQVERGSTVPEFETFLAALEPGQVCPVVIASRYGMHVLCLHARAEPVELPYEAVEPRIRSWLHEASWRQGVHQYIARLAAAATIEGFALPVAADGPLVQ